MKIDRQIGVRNERQPSRGGNRLKRLLIEENDFILPTGTHSLPRHHGAAATVSPG